MSGTRTPTHDELALLSAFLDGELSPRDEAGLLDKLSQRPDLQDALDELAEQMAAATRAFADDAANDSAHDGADIGNLIAARVMAEVDAGAVAADVEAAETLASLARDGASNSAQDRRLEELLATPQLADAAASFVAAADVARAAVNVDNDAVARGLATLPEHVLARVERTERGWALATAAADGALSAAEANELVGLCGADEDVFDAVSFAVRHQPHVSEALRASVSTPAFLRDAERAGAAALQAIAAAALVEHAEAARAAAAVTKTTTTTQTTTQETSVSLLSRLTSFFRGPALAPLFAATAAFALFVVVGKNDPPTTKQPEPSAFAALQQAFIDAAAPIVLADNRALPSGELAVLGDNGADVEAIDATGTTMVFSTAESNITIIWVDGLGDDSDKEQGT